MNKYEHKIASATTLPNELQFTFEGEKSAKIERLSANVLRISVQTNDTPLLPTFAIAQGGDVGKNGRPRLSKEDFSCPAFDSIEKLCDRISAKLNEYTLIVHDAPFRLSIEKNGVEIYSDRKTQSYNFYGELGSSVCHYVERKSGEKHFGLGDKGGDVDKTGRRFRISCLDAMGYDGDRTDVLYHHVPFYITKADGYCYGVYYDTHADSVIDLGNELDNYHGAYKYFSTEDDALVYYIILGDIKTVLTTFSSMLGKSKLMPLYSFDYAGSTMAFTDSDDSERQLSDFLDTCKQKSFSCRSFYLSSGYTSIGDKRCVFTWNREKFPDVKGLTQKFNQSGTRFIANIKPCFLTTHPMYDDLAKKGWFLHYKDGTPALSQFWDGLGSYLDFTDPDAYDFWVCMVKTQLIDNGIYSTWNDNNEYEIWDDEVYCKGFGDGEIKAKRIKPVFSYLMTMASQEAQNTAKTPTNFMSVRSCGLGATRYAATWTGDNFTRFETLRANHKMAMSMSLSGIFNFGHDIGGFSGSKPTRELFLRWLQNGVFTPRFCIHSWNEDGSATLPWMYDDITDSVRELFKERYSLLPYIYSTAAKSSNCATPIIAPMFYHFDDEKVSVESDDFMLGDSLLAVNIFDEGKTEREVYLPKDCGWYMGEKYYAGGQIVSVKFAPTDTAPYFVKEGSILPLASTENYGFSERPLDVTLNVFAKETGEIKCDYFTEKADGEVEKCEITVAFKKNEVEVKAENAPANGLKFALIDKNHRPLIIK